jgi:hypothetical protein
MELNIDIEQTYLAGINGHERDKNILRETREKSDGSGTYDVWTVNGDAFYKGVTSFIGGCFDEFDADAVIDKMMKSPKWPKSPYFGMEKQEIKDMWSAKGEKAAKDGTNMHYTIECYYNNEKINEDYLWYNTDEYQQFLQFAEDYKHLKPYRTEWLVYHEEAKIKGIIDMVFENEDGTLSIYDWKRTKGLSKTNRWQSAKKPVDHLPDTNYWHYSLQLNVYKRILEEKYRKTVKEMYLVCLYPEQGKYIREKVPSLPDEMDTLFNNRIDYVNYVNKKKEEKSDIKKEETGDVKEDDDDEKKDKVIIKKKVKKIIKGKKK